jgi:hypothetical protein
MLDQTQASTLHGSLETFAEVEDEWNSLYAYD